MPRFNLPNHAPDAVNMEKAPAWQMSPKLELAAILLTSLMTDQFYRSSADAQKRLATLTAQEPQFAARAALYARREFGMRSASHVAAAAIARSAKGETWTKDFFRKIIYRPDDMAEILALLADSKGQLNAVPNSVKKGFGQAISQLSPYQLAKYRLAGHKVNLADIVNLCHPKPTERNRQALKSLMKGELRLDNENATWEARLSAAGQEQGADDAETAELQAAAKEQAWSDLLSNNRLGYFALIRNLRNIHSQAPEVLDLALEQLRDPARIKRSLVFPYRYLTAMQHTPDEPRIRAAISDAADLALNNAPLLPGRTLVCVDNSGSMSWGAGSQVQVARRRRKTGKESQPQTLLPTVTASHQAAMFAAAIFKASPQNKDSQVEIITFGNDAKYRRNLNPRDSLLSLTFALIENQGGTSYEAIFKKAAEEKQAYDRFIILSDSQSWLGHTGQVALRNYRQSTEANPSIYAIDLVSYGTLQFPEEKCAAIAGFSEKIFDLMALLEDDRNALLNRIEAEPLE